MKSSIKVILLCLLIGLNSFSAFAYTNEELDSLIAQEKTYQNHAHTAADSLRALGYPEDSEIIQLCKTHWSNSANNINLYKSMYTIPNYSAYYSEVDVTIMAQVIYTEARGLNRTEQSKVGWCILNRVDKGWGSIISVITAKGQFAYRSGAPATDELKQLSREILKEWVDEKYGIAKGTRTLGVNYIYFYGNGKTNVYRTAY